METKPDGYEQLGEKHLLLADAIAQSVGFMAPVFSAALLIPLIVGLGASGRGAGVATPIAVIIAAIGVAALGWIVAAYAKRIHAAGSLYDYVTHGFGERVGFWAGWVYYGGTLALTAAVPLFWGGLVQDFLKNEYNIGVPWWILALAYEGLLFTLLYLGVRISTRVQLTLVLISATVVLGFFLYIIAKGGVSGNTVKPFLPGKAADGWSGIFFGVLYGVLIFVGFETAANLGEETAEPAKSIPRAIFLAVGIVTLFYLIAAYAQDIGFGLNVKKWISSPAPLFDLGAPGAFGSRNFDRLLQIVVILDVTAVGLGAAVSTSRGIFALARDRRLPGILARVSRRFGTPSASTVLTVLVCVFITLWTRIGHGVLPAIIPGAEYFAMFVWLATFGGFALVGVYSALSVGALRGLWPVENKVKLVIAATLGLAISGGAIFGSIYKVPHPANKVPWAVLFLFAAGVLVSLVAKGRRPETGLVPASGAPVESTATTATVE